MAALLVSLSIVAIMMTAVMPVWKQMARREKEEELIFRGQQYSRALRLFGTKYANASPPNLDVLVEQRFIRKKYKDPITNDDFQPILAGQALLGNSTSPQPNQNQGRGSGDQGRGGTPGLDSGARTSPFAAGSSNPFAGVGVNQPAAAQPGTTGRGISPIGTPGAGATGGVIGVVSKSKDTSIRLYNGRNHYNEWAFVGTPQVQAPGLGGARGAGPGRGGPGGTGPGGTPPSPFGTNPFGGRGTSPGPGGPPNGPGRGSPTSPFGPARPIQPPPTRPR
jgi:type II secretory pathway pseudopilin PulG